MNEEKNNTQSVPVITASKTKEKDIILDDKGFFVIEVFNDHINVEYYHNVIKDKEIVSGKLNTIFTGTSAKALCDTIAVHIKDLRPEHYLYLGRELLRAEQSLSNHEPYEQDGC